MELHTWYLALSAASLVGVGALGISWRFLRRLWRRKKVTEEQRIECARNLRIMEELMDTDGWKLLAAAADAQVQRRMNQVLLEPTENTHLDNYQKGEIAGIKLFTAIPRKLIEESKAVLAAYEKQEEGV